MKLYLLLFGLLGIMGCAQAQTDNTEPILVTPEVMPEYPGGEQALTAYMFNMPFPAPKGEGICGKIIVSFVVDTVGDVNNVSVYSTCMELDVADSLLQYIEDMPQWKPGSLYGKKTNTPMVIPINVNFKK